MKKIFDVSCKVKYFALFWEGSERLSEDSWERQCSSVHVFRSTVVPGAQPVISCGSCMNTIDMESCHEETISFKALQSINSAESVLAAYRPVVVHYFS